MVYELGTVDSLERVQLYLLYVEVSRAGNVEPDATSFEEQKKARLEIYQGGCKSSLFG